MGRNPLHRCLLLPTSYERFARQIRQESSMPLYKRAATSMMHLTILTKISKLLMNPCNIRDFYRNSTPAAIQGSVAGALRTQHNLRPSAFTFRLSHGLGMQLRMGQQAVDNLSSGSVRWTGVIVAKRRSVRFTCSASKGPGVRHAIHREEYRYSV